MCERETQILFSVLLRLIPKVSQDRTPLIVWFKTISNPAGIEQENALMQTSLLSFMLVGLKFETILDCHLKSCRSKNRENKFSSIMKLRIVFRLVRIAEK